jgi:2-methylisocitrate lyase-like PEP mutase family enzyme
MTAPDLASAFFALHVKGVPLILYNVWDAGSARAVADAGAKAIATGSWSVATSNGYTDGEQTPLDLVEQVARSIVSAVTLPVTIDFEGAYAADPGLAAANTARLITTGCVGINFEDRIVGGTGLHTAEMQSRRIAAIRKSAEAAGRAFFINARTDLFLEAPDAESHASLLNAAVERSIAYRDAGASGLFAPGLTDESLIERLCAACPLPVNIMMQAGMPDRTRLAELGVSRISYGPAPYRMMGAWLRDTARAAFE